MKVLNIDGIEIFNSVYEYLDSNMYLFFNSKGEAVLIDPHIDLEFLSLLKERNISKLYILLTHEHTDHTSGIYWYQERFDSELICHQNCAAFIAKKSTRLPLLTSFILEEHDRLFGTHQFDKFKSEYIPRSYTADTTYETTLDLTINDFDIHIEHVPGHSKGSSLIIVNDNIAFTGDSLLKVDPVITRFPGSNHQQYVEFTLPKLSLLNPEINILPGHGDSFQLKELMVNGKLNIEYK